MAVIKVGTKAKVVIGIINTRSSIHPSNEAFVCFSKQPPCQTGKASTPSQTQEFSHLEIF